MNYSNPQGRVKELAQRHGRYRDRRLKHEALMDLEYKALEQKIESSWNIEPQKLAKYFDKSYCLSRVLGGVSFAAMARVSDEVLKEGFNLNSQGANAGYTPAVLPIPEA